MRTLNFSRRAASIAVLALALALGLSTIAHAQQSLERFFANRDLPGSFWADDDAHTIVSLENPARYQVCNLLHTSGQNQRAILAVDADGTSLQLHQGRCSDVDAAVITVRSATRGVVAHGSYRHLN